MSRFLRLVLGGGTGATSSSSSITSAVVRVEEEGGSRVKGCLVEESVLVD